jgi:hypothetical protein
LQPATLPDSPVRFLRAAMHIPAVHHANCRRIILDGGVGSLAMIRRDRPKFNACQ